MTLWIFEHVACYSESYCRSYVAPRCSPAYCFCVLCALAFFFVPLWLSFASDNFWVKEGLYHEQPLVGYAHELFMVLAGSSPTNSLGWTSRSGLSSLLQDKVRVPIVRSTPLDDNRDGVPDAWRLVLEMPTGNVSTGFRQLTLLAVYTFELRERVLERLAALAVLDIASPFPATGVWVRGRWRFRQGRPLRLSSEVRDVYAGSPLAAGLSSNWLTQHTPLTLAALLGRYAAQNETASLELTVPPIWDFTPRESFRAEVTLDVPPQPVYYVPGSLEVLKFAWIQYLSLLVPVGFGLQCVLSYMYNWQIVETYVVPHLPPRGGADGGVS